MHDLAPLHSEQQLSTDWAGSLVILKPFQCFLFLGGEHLGLKVRLAHRGSSLSQEWLRELVSLVDSDTFASNEGVQD